MGCLSKYPKEDKIDKVLNICDNDKELSDEEYRRAIYALFAKYRRSKARGVVIVNNARVVAYIKSPRDDGNKQLFSTSDKNGNSGSIDHGPHQPSAPKPALCGIRPWIRKHTFTQKQPINSAYSPLPPITLKPAKNDVHRNVKIDVEKPHAGTDFRKRFAGISPINKAYLLLPPIYPDPVHNNHHTNSKMNKERKIVPESLLPVPNKAKESWNLKYQTNITVLVSGTGIPISENMAVHCTFAKYKDFRKSDFQANYTKKDSSAPRISMSDNRSIRHKPLSCYCEIPANEITYKVQLNNRQKCAEYGLGDQTIKGHKLPQIRPSRIPVRCRNVVHKTPKTANHKFSLDMLNNP